jgi:hypothetical protein
MSTESFNVLFYVPYNTEQINDADITWLDNFQSILRISTEQILKQEIIISNPFGKKNNIVKDPNDFDIIIQFILHEDYLLEKCIQQNVPKTDQLRIQLICKPNINISGLNQLHNIKTFDIFDHSRKGANDLIIKNLNNDIWLKIIDITHELKVHLVQRKKKSEKIIFIAETSPDQKNNRQNLIREFTHLGFRVVPDNELPNDMMQFTEQASDLMNDAVLSVHIIGNEYAPLLENIEVSKVEIQNDIFSEIAASNRLIKRFVWIPPNLKPKSEKQKQYIESFKRNIELLVNTEIVQAPIELFKSILKENLDVSEKANNITFDKQEQKGKTVYLIHSDDAENRAKEIKTILKKNNIQLLDNSNSTNKIEQIQQHKKNLVKCDLVFILYSSENEQWLHSKLNDIVKSPGFGKTNAFDLKVLLLDTDKKPMILSSLKDLQVIDIKNKNISEPISSLIEKK